MGASPVKGRESCIIVNRVSSAEQRDGYSLDAQSRHGKEYVQSRGFLVLREFTFQESASKTREKRQFDEVLSFIATHRGRTPLHVIVEKKDRWGRLHSRKEYIQQLVLEGRVVLHYYREGQVFDENCSPEDIFMDDVVTSMNKYTALNIGREAKKGMLEKARQGWLPHKPPPGYRNNPDRSAPQKIIADESERHWVVRMFELRGNQRLSYEAIVQTLLSDGSTPPRRRATLRKSYVEKILKNPFYAGTVLWKGKEFAGKHELIIPPQLHRRVVESFKESGRQLKRKVGAVFADFFRCGVPDCACKITYHQKHKPSGRVYHLYACANGRRVHTSMKGMYMSESEIFEGLQPAVENISISADMAQAIAKALNANHLKLQSKLRREIESYRGAQRSIEAQEDDAVRLLQRGLLTEDLFKRQIGNLRSDRERLTGLILELQGSATDTYLQTAHSILELAKDAKRLWLSRSREERAEFLRKILWNPRITGSTIEYELKKPLEVVAKMASGEEWGG